MGPPHPLRTLANDIRSADPKALSPHLLKEWATRLELLAESHEWSSTSRVLKDQVGMPSTLFSPTFSHGKKLEDPIWTSDLNIRSLKHDHGGQTHPFISSASAVEYAVSASLTLLLEGLAGVFGADFAACYAPCPNELKMVATVNCLPGGAVPILSIGIPATVMQSGIAATIDQYLDDPQPAAQGVGGPSLICFPVWADDHRSCLGAVQLLRRTPPFKREEEATLKAHTALVAHILAHYPYSCSHFNVRTLQGASRLRRLHPRAAATSGVQQTQLIWRKECSGQSLKLKEMERVTDTVTPLITDEFKEVQLYMDELECTWRQGAAESASIRQRAEELGRQLAEAREQLWHKSHELQKQRHHFEAHAKSCEPFRNLLNTFSFPKDDKPVETIHKRESPQHRAIRLQLFDVLKRREMLGFVQELQTKSPIGPAIVNMVALLRKSLASEHPLPVLFALLSLIYEAFDKLWQPRRYVRVLFRNAVNRLAYNKLLLAKEALVADQVVTEEVQAVVNRMEAQMQRKLRYLGAEKTKIAKSRRLLQTCFDPNASLADSMQELLPSSVAIHLEKGSSVSGGQPSPEVAEIIKEMRSEAPQTLKDIIGRPDFLLSRPKGPNTVGPATLLSLKLPALKPKKEKVSARQNLQGDAVNPSSSVPRTNLLPKHTNSKKALPALPTSLLR